MSLLGWLFGVRERRMVAIEDVENILLDRIAEIEQKKALASQRTINILIDGNSIAAATMSKDVHAYDKQLDLLNELLADLELTDE